MASKLKVDEFEGVTTAGSIDVTSGSTTTNLQQGLAKVWATLNAFANPVVSIETFNVSSVQDDAAGKYGITYTNSMNTATYLVTSSASYHSQTQDFDRYIAGDFGGGAMDARRTSSQTKIGYYAASYLDTYVVGTNIHGDLA